MTTRATDLLLPQGDHASRPASAAKGALYPCTTHSLVYQWDGAAWQTWATLAPGSDAPDWRRINATTLPDWTRAAQLSLYDQAPTRILCVGDSTTGGVYSDSYTTATGSTNQGGPNSYPARLAEFLNAAGVPAIYAMAIPGHAEYGGNPDSRWSLGAAVYTGIGTALGAGGNSGLSLGTTATTLTPGVRADTYKVYYFGDPGTGSFNAQAGGGATVTTATAQATAGIYSVTLTAPTVSASNVVTMARASGTVFIAGVEYWDSTNPNQVRILGSGVGGAKTVDWTTDAGKGGLAWIDAVAADLHIISLGVNDIAAGVSAATAWTNIETIAARCGGDVLLMTCVPSNAGDRDALNDLYRASDRPTIDLDHRYGTDMNAIGLLTVDQTHPNALGYGDIAGVITRALTIAAGVGGVSGDGGVSGGGNIPNWQTATLLNSWVNYGSGQQVAQYGTANGKGYARASIKNGLTGYGNPIMQLPVAARPAAPVNRLVYAEEAGTGVSGRLYVETNGNMHLIGTTNNDLVSFEIEWFLA